jgi:predicted nucleotide-binding protein
MPYYHIRIAYGISNQPHRKYDYELDLSEEETKAVAEQYVNGESVLFNGKWVNIIDLEEIQIRETPEKTTYYFPELSRLMIFEGSTFPKVTRRFIKSPPKGQTSAKSRVAAQPLSKNIFIVHGRDHEPMKELKAMLYEFGLDPIVLHEQPSGSRTIVEQLEKHSDVGYAFVILTPDDVGCLSDEFNMNVAIFLEVCKDSQKANQATEQFKEIIRTLQTRARQNVVLEFGYFIGLLTRDRVCCLLKGNVEKPSDMDGIVYLSFRNSVEEIRLKIMKELNKAGYEIKL